MAAKKASGRKPKGGWSIPIDDLGKAVQKALVQIYGKGGAKTVARMYKAGKTVQVPTVAQRAAASAEKKASKVAAKKNAQLRTERLRGEASLPQRARNKELIEGTTNRIKRVEVQEANAYDEAYQARRAAGKTKRKGGTSKKAQVKSGKDAAKISGGMKAEWSKQRKDQTALRRRVDKAPNPAAKQKARSALIKHIREHGEFK